MASPDSVSAPSLPEQSGHGPAMVRLVIPIIGCGPGGIVLSWICPVPLHRHGSSNGAPNGQPFSDSSGRKIRRKSLPAERAGFEPARQLSPSTDLANRRFRPLSHLSRRQQRARPTKGHSSRAAKGQQGRRQGGVRPILARFFACLERCGSVRYCLDSSPSCRKSSEIQPWT
jgi:hypothetical protein